MSNSYAPRTKSSVSISTLIALTRPRTLVAALSPVVIAIAYAWRIGYKSPWDALLCLIVAIGAQIASNVANDYFDYKKGTDTPDRIGPTRPLSQGLISERVVLLILYGALSLTIIAGLILTFRHTWWFMLIGLFVCLGILAYSAGPYPLSSVGLGDIAVLVFFGIIPTVMTGYVLGIPLGDTALWCLSLAIGLANICILVANNYRDYEEDMKTGKGTSIVRFGKRFGRILYFCCGLGAMVIVIVSGVISKIYVLLIPYGAFHLTNCDYLTPQNCSSINDLLGRSAMGVLLLTLSIVIGLLLF